jgi:uncharacterized protein YjbI with pentapeptide repeats
VEERPNSTNKRLWDLLVVIGVLLVGAAIGYWFSAHQQYALQKKIDNRLANLNQGERSPKDAVALQAYLDHMSQLLLAEDLLDSDADSEVQQVARARTLAIVSNLDARANRSITRFLTDTDLVKGSDSVRLLAQAHLPDAELGGAYLPAADLDTSYLRGADLSDALLTSANLSAAILSDANLKRANLQYANLQYADLEGADLTQANLSHAKVTAEQLNACESLEGATMPDGTERD